ncbi:MAG: tol-pal system protein YbgF [Nitrospirae bacterium]|nr:tol-pal system protein YbgF [Nitrospirota bacterium]
MKSPLPVSKIFCFLILIFALSGILGCAATSPEVKTLHDKSVLLEKEVQELKRYISSQEEKTNVALNVVTAFRDRMSDLETRTKELETSAAQSSVPPFPTAMPEAAPQEPVQTESVKQVVPQPSSPPPSAAPSPSDGGVVPLYQKGLQHLTEKRYAKAMATFQDITRRAPTDPLADNAQYWIGEIYYSQRDFQTALREFQKVVDLYPEGNKTPDAYLKISFCLLELGKSREARKELEKIITLYPTEEVSGIARTKLEKLSREE